MKPIEMLADELNKIDLDKLYRIAYGRDDE